MDNENKQQYMERKQKVSMELIRLRFDLKSRKIKNEIKKAAFKT
jgi:hypothetical protein